MAKSKVSPNQQRIENLQLRTAIATAAAAGVPLDTREAAIYSGMSPGRLAILRGEGRGPQFVLVNSRPRYLKSYLDSYLLEAKPRRRATPGAGRPPKGSGKKRAVR